MPEPLTITALAIAVTALVNMFRSFETPPAPNPTIIKVEQAAEKGGSDVPSYYPTQAQIHRAKKLLEIPDYFHIGISGRVKTGKSSLINALRGIDRHHHAAAPVGHTEKTATIIRYLDPRGESSPFSWWDIPGAGTQQVPAKDYFNEQGLFVLDCIILIIRDTFQETDGEIVWNCQRLDIPTYIVRSRCDEALRSELDNEDPKHASFKKLQEARSVVSQEIRDNVKRELGRYKGPDGHGLGDQQVYLVNQHSMLDFVRSQYDAESIIGDPCAFDEVELVYSIMRDADHRRPRRARS